MTHHTLLLHRLLCFASLLICTLSFTSLVYAQRQRNYVSAQHGNDANVTTGCPVTLPCRNFAAAIGVVAPGGEVVALDSGGYGPTIISKSVTLTGAPGVYVGITALTPGSSAITVGAASTDTVVLRGLTLTGFGGLFGIYTTAVGNLHVENCVIGGFAGSGIFVGLQADGSHIFVKDTTIRNNGNGMEIRTTTGTARASIDNCRSERNDGYGFYANYNSRVTINRSVASGNGAGFVSISTGGGETTEMTCLECVASNNTEGFVVIGAERGVASIHVSHSTATYNKTIGFVQSGSGVFESLGNNLVRRNIIADTLGTITVITAQ